MELIERLRILNNHLIARNYKKVLEGCNSILKKNPNNAYVLNLAGLALQGAKNFSTSINFFKKAIEVDPSNFSAINNLANTYKSLLKMDIAEELYQRALKINPKYVHALNNYGNLKQKIGDFQGSINLYLKALDIVPNQIAILYSLASVYQKMGDFIKSKKLVNKILKIDPKNILVHKLLSNITDYKEEKDHLGIMENLSQDKSLNEEQLIDLFFSLGKAYEELSNYEKSYVNLEKANKLKKSKVNYKSTYNLKLYSSIIKNFENIDLSKFKKKFNSKKIIFICGMPRSGTTLVEQIIASHPEVYGAGELIYLQNIVEKNFIEDFNLNKQKIVDQASSSNNIIEQGYFELLNLHKFNSNIITDKAPQNFRWIGFMKIFFPNCKIIHCNRNAKDNCLSLYKNNFPSPHMNWCYDQNDLSEYYNLYKNLMKFWHQKIPNEIFNANYENLINNTEAEIKKLIEFCDLKWNPICLDYYKSKKTPISTVSAVQARKPIYNSSINSHAKYANYLSALFDTL